jgi:uncharacterized protein YqgQ
MNVSITNSLPLIVAEENDAMLNSIINLLRQKGFVVLVQDRQSAASLVQKEQVSLDALSILRLVSEQWPQDQAVNIVSFQEAPVAQLMSIAA